VNLENSFAQANPDLIEEWHPSKNLPDTPYNIAPQTTNKYHWVCKTCEHEWEASASTRSCGAGCPQCAEFKNRQLTKKQEWKSLNQKLVLKSKRISHGK